MTLTVCIPLLCWGVIFATFRRSGLPDRSSFLAASVSWGVLVAITTEVLGLAGSIHEKGVLGAWMCCLLAATATYRFVPRRTTSNRGKTFAHLSFPCPATTAIAAIVGLTALIAVIAPPNNYDAMTYHLGRVVHWLQNHSVDHYPTHVARQLYSSPWAEFAILHLQLLTGSDTMTNLVQWFAMLGSIVGVTLIAEELQGNGRAQLLAAVTCATIPMGILQSSSPQNDYVLAFWMVCFIYFSQRAHAKPRLVAQLLMAGSLGLAILTKGTAYPLAFPLVVWSSWRSAKHGSSAIIRQITLMAIVILALNAGHYMRNYRLFGNPISTADDRLANETLKLENVAVNAGRNLAMQFATPSASVNETLVAAVKRLYGPFSIEINNPLNTMGSFTLRPLTQLHEDFAINPLHALLILVSLLVLTGKRALGPNPALSSYAMAITGSYLLYCFLLKWQPFGSRLLLPLFVAWSPAIALTITEAFSRKVVNALQALLVLASLPWLFFNTSRPLVTIPAVVMNRLAPGITVNHSILTTAREEQYYANKPHFRQVFKEIAKEIGDSKCTQVGLEVGKDFWEYPLWKEVEKNANSDVIFEHIHVANPSGNIPSYEISLCLTVQAGTDNLPHVASASPTTR